MPLDTPDPTAVPPPFDVAPSPAPVEPRTPPMPARRGNGKKPPVPAALFFVFLSAGALVGGAGFVAGFSFTRFFGESPKPLSVDPEPSPEPVGPLAPPAEEESRPRKSPLEARLDPLPLGDHPLEVARERLDAGDPIGARRAATDFLLVRDSLSAEELRNTAKAYALLADSIRVEIERAKHAGGPR